MKNLLKITMRRRWAHRAGWNEHGWTRMGFGLWISNSVSVSSGSSVSSSESRELHKGKSLYFISSSRVPRTDSIYSLLNKSIFLLSLLIITLTISCSHKFPKGHLFELMILRKLLPTSTSTTPAPNTTPTPVTTVNTNKYIFLTVGTHKGNFDTSATIPGNNNGNGIDDADTFCQTEKANNYASLPGSASDYKAFIVDGTNRRACSTNDCSGGISENINWVLKANTDYYRLDGTTDTKVFTTNSSGIVNFTGGGLLLTPIDSSTLTKWWTGMDTNWVFTSVACTVTWASTSLTANHGAGGTTTAISTNLTTSCNASTPPKLLCVRQ